MDNEKIKIGLDNGLVPKWHHIIMKSMMNNFIASYMCYQIRKSLLWDKLSR